MAQDYELNIMTFIKSYNFFDERDADKRKNRLVRLQMNNMLRRTVNMFKWEGLPDTIPQRVLELYCQTKGFCGIIKVKGKLYCVTGGLGGVPNYNYMPSNFIVSNPYLNLNANSYNIYENKNCVIIPNDSLYQGIMPLCSYHAELLAESSLTLRRLTIINRFPNLLIAPDDNTKKDIDDFLKNLENGDVSAVAAKNILKDATSVPLSNTASNIITQTLEMRQYEKAEWFNDIGLQMNYNMKRESITSSEAQLGEGALLPLPDDMLEQRRIAAKEIGDIFGVNITVDFNGAWKDLRDSIAIELEAEKNKIVNSNKAVQTSGQEQNKDKDEDEEDKETT